MLQPISALNSGNPQPAPQGSGRTLDPLSSLRNHKRLAAAVFAVVTLAGLPYAWFKGRAVWRAEGVLYVSPRFLSNLETNEEHELQSNSQYREYVEQQIRTVNRYDILNNVLHKSGLMARWKKPNETERRAVERLQMLLQVASVPDTYQVTVDLDGDKAAGLAELVNAVMSEFTETARKELIWDAEGRIGKLNTEKTNLEAEIQGLMERKNGIADQLGTTVFNDSIINSYDTRLASALDALEEARRQRFAAETSLSGQAVPGVAAAAMDKAMTDAGLSSLRSALNQRKAALMTSIHGLSPQHTGRIAAEKEIREIDGQIEQLTAQANSRWQNGLQDINRSKYEQAKQLEAKIQVEADRLRGQAESFSRGYQSSLDVGEEIARVRRRLNATEDRIGFLTLETAAPGFVRVFSPAMTPDIPFKGGRKKLFLMALLAAMLLAAAVPTGIDLMDPRIMTVAELEAASGMPVSGDGLDAKRLAVIVRRHIEHLPRKTLVLTGLSDRSNSDQTALEVGRELKSLGLRVLVVEAKPGQGSQNRPGLAELIAGRTGLHDCILHGTHGAVDRVYGGGALQDRDLLPADPLLKAIEASEDYDLVLISAAPVTQSLAAEELVRLSGAALLAVAAGHDTRTKLKEAISLLTRLEPKAFGTVLISATRKNEPILSANSQENSHDTSDLLAA